MYLGIKSGATESHNFGAKDANNSEFNVPGCI